MRSVERYDPTHPRADGAGRSGIGRALAAEARRLRGDPVPWLFLPVTLLSAASLLAGLPDDIRSAPAEIIDGLGAMLSGMLFGGLLVGAAVLCAFGPTFAERTGVRAREQLFVPAIAAATARALSSIVVAVLYVGVGATLLQVIFVLATERMLQPADQFACLLAAGAIVGLWGFLLGVVMRNPLLVLFTVPLTLLPAMLLVEQHPEVARLLPLPVMLTIAGAVDESLDMPLTLLLAAGWLGVLILVTAGLERRRDRL